MKIFHLSDLHIGKQLNGYSLKENQEAVLGQIVEETKIHRPDVILICGDIYDKTIPSGEAYTIFDGFLGKLSEIKPEIPVLMIAGNHDSPERLQYASSFLEKHHIHISVLPPQSGEEYLKKIVRKDLYGSVNFYLLPFTKPGYVRFLLGGSTRPGYGDAVFAVLDRENINWKERNVLLSHQFFVSGNRLPNTCDSEQITLVSGGLDHVDASLVERFDYVALGHLHGAQKVGENHIRYSGTPYKYSVSEEHHKKAITVVELKDKGTAPEISFLPLKGLQDVRRIKGGLNEIIDQAGSFKCHDFVSITITDEKEPYHMREQLEEIYDYLLELKIDNSRTRRRLSEPKTQVCIQNPAEAFRLFYETVRGCSLTEEEEKVMSDVIGQALEEG